MLRQNCRMLEATGFELSLFKYSYSPLGPKVHGSPGGCAVKRQARSVMASMMGCVRFVVGGLTAGIPPQSRAGAPERQSTLGLPFPRVRFTWISRLGGCDVSAGLSVVPTGAPPEPGFASTMIMKLTPCGRTKICRPWPSKNGVGDGTLWQRHSEFAQEAHPPEFATPR